MEGDAQKCSKRFIIGNKLGLHARPAAMFVKLANTFTSEIWVKLDDDEVNGKSIMGLMMLGASCGTSVKVTVSGQDEIEAAAAIKTLIQNRFGEEH